MPELPEVEALASFLREQAVGRVVAGVEIASISALKTFDPSTTAFHGLEVTGVHRHGKFLDLDVDGLHLVFHLARAGWLRWSDRLPDTTLRLSASPIVARIRLESGAGFDLTEASTRKSVAVHAVRDPADVPGIAALGPDPLVPGFDIAPLAAGRRAQIKGLLRDQTLVAGIGNAYSDEILHAARLSPFAIAGDLDEAELDRLNQAIRDVLGAAIAAAMGRPATELKDAKRGIMNVHGRTGKACPVCGTTIAEVVFADSSLQYCPNCQTGGRVLKNRSTSKFIK